MRRLRSFGVFMAALAVMTVGVARPAAANAGAALGVLHSTMNGANEVPGPGDPNASGSTLVVLVPSSGVVCYVIRVSGLSSPPTAAHIHVGAAGTAGPVVIPLALNGGPKTFFGCTTADKALVQRIVDNPSGFYTNVHNAQYPGGAIRGQLSSLLPAP